MEGFDKLALGEYDDDCHAAAEELKSKNWCKPLQTSMSRLIQMQPSVCSMFLQDAASLKPPKSMTKIVRQRKQREAARQCLTMRDNSVGGDNDDQGNFSTESGQDSFRSVSKLSSWGSSSSIPELLARQKSLASSRPSSASKVPLRQRPDSGGRRIRPQSAKGSLSSKTVEASKDLGVKGSKKPVDSRPPVCPRSNVDTGLPLKDSDTVVWAYPTGRDSPSHQNQSQATLDEKMPDSPAPESSPTEFEVIPEMDNFLRVSQEEEKPVVAPVPESIRFSLPNMNDGSDDNDDDDDEDLDTERLLQQADDIVQKKCREDKRVLDSLADARATIPYTDSINGDDFHYENHFCQDDQLLLGADNFDPTCPISHVASHNNNSSSNNRIHVERGSPQEGNRSNSNNRRSQEVGLHSPHVTWSDSHTVRLFQRDSPYLVKDEINASNNLVSTCHVGETLKDGKVALQRTGKRSGHDISASSAAGEDVVGNGSSGDVVHKLRDTKSKGESKAETFRNHKNGTNKAAEDKFLMLDETPPQYKPLEVEMKTQGTKVRPTSAKNMDPKAALVNGTESDSSSQSLRSCLSQKSVDLDSHTAPQSVPEPSHKLVPTVTLAYESETEEKDKEEELKSKSGKKKKKRKGFDDIETYMGRMDQEEKEALRRELEGGSKPSCLCGRDVPCSELIQEYGLKAQDPVSQTGTTATAQTPGHMVRPRSAATDYLAARENRPVVKTTKTIEFGEEGAGPAETVNKTPLVAQREVKSERPWSGGERLEQVPSTLKPSAIKRQQITEEKTRPRPTSALTRRPTAPEKTMTSSSGSRAQPIVRNSSTQSTRSSTKPTCVSPASSAGAGHGPGPDVESMEGGLAPPSASSLTSDTRRSMDQMGQDVQECEVMLQEAKAMALASLTEAVRRPTSGKKKYAAKTTADHSISTGTEIIPTSNFKSRPFSAPLKIAKSEPHKKPTIPFSTSNESGKHKYCQGHSGSSASTHNHTGIRRAQSARPGRLTNGLSTLRDQEDNSPEMHQAQRMQMKMASMGVDIDAKTLERALFPPSGKSVYYDIPGCLPRNPTETLIPHFKHWLAEDYKRIQVMNRKLAQDDHIKYLQRVAAEKKAAAAAAKKAALGKKKGKKKVKAKQKQITTAD